METINKDIFAQLVSSTLQVELPSGFTLNVRRVPFTTTMRVLSEIASMIHGELLESSSDILNLITDVAEDNTLTDAAKGMLVLEKCAPHIIRVILASPPILEGLLHDLVVDITDEVIAAVSTEDALAIIVAAFDAMDKAVIAKQVAAVFFGVVEVLKIAMPPTEKVEPEQQEQVSQPTALTEKPE